MLSSEIEAGERLERQLYQDRQAIVSARSGRSAEDGHEEMS